MYIIFKSEQLVDAAMVCDMLVASGIEAQRVGGEVWLSGEEDRARASELVVQMREGPSSAREWRCRDCRESNPGEFGVCWNCGEAPGH